MTLLHVLDLLMWAYSVTNLSHYLPSSAVTLHLRKGVTPFLHVHSRGW